MSARLACWLAMPDERPSSGAEHPPAPWFPRRGMFHSTTSRSTRRLTSSFVGLF